MSHRDKYIGYDSGHSIKRIILYSVIIFCYNSVWLKVRDRMTLRQSGGGRIRCEGDTKLRKNNLRVTCKNAMKFMQQ